MVRFRDAELETGTGFWLSIFDITELLKDSVEILMMQLQVLTSHAMKFIWSPISFLNS